MAHLAPPGTSKNCYATFHAISHKVQNLEGTVVLGSQLLLGNRNPNLLHLTREVMLDNQITRTTGIC